MRSVFFCLSLVLCAVLVGRPVAAADAPVPWAPADYFDEPKNLPFDEELQERKQEDGWHWQEFRYTSLVYQGEPIRIHAVYAVPDAADAAHKAPAILMTHGIFGAVRGADTRYWSAVTTFVKAGYAVLFFDWYPDFAHNWKPKTPNEPKRFSTFGKLDYFTPYYSYLKSDNDMKDSLFYQVAIAAKRGVTWLQARPEVDGTAIGATGWSYGGIFSSMIAGIDDRIAAVNPCVYNARFGPKEEGYNSIGLDAPTLATWQSRFDSFVLLAHRSVPVLYTIGANDSVFPLPKAMEIYAAMKGPKHLLMGPNAGHEYWAVEQGVLFFDAALKKKFARPAVADLKVERAGTELTLSVKVDGDAPQKVEFFAAPIFELDPDKAPEKIGVDAWTWTGIDAGEAGNGQYTARWAPPVMRPINAQERLYHWGAEDILDPKAPPAPAPADYQRGIIRIFTRVTDKNGAMECSPVSEPLPWTDPPARETHNIHVLPALEAAARVTANTMVEVNPAVPDGQAMAILNAPLPLKAVGTKGYVIWNWRNTNLSDTLVTDGTATPTKKVLAPFVDTFRVNAFTGGRPWAHLNRGGLIAFSISGKPDELNEQKRGYHGSLDTLMPSEDVAIEAKDDQVHHLTLVMAGGGQEECNVRVSLIAPDGATETVLYRHTPTADRILQFHFTGKAILRIQATSRPPNRLNYTQVGPTALFLD